MKRLQAGILALLLCIALALPGCGGTQLQETIPTMNLVSGSRKAAIPKFGYSWNYKGQGEVADPIHPLDAAASPDLLPTVGAAAGTVLDMEFSLLPDNVSVTYWPVSENEPDYEGGQPLTATLTAGHYGIQTPESPGDVVVLVSTQWSSYQDVSGSVSYAFRLTQKRAQ